MKRRTAIAGLALVNVAGALGLAWLSAVLLFYDGVMVVELSICAGLIAVIAAITSGALLLHRRNRTTAAIALLSLAALPIIAVCGFLLYLWSHPIDMR